ncbi:MAG: hypothetical protein P8Y69_11605 [Gammaproteobacteria bacterium]
MTLPFEPMCQRTMLARSLRLSVSARARLVKGVLAAKVMMLPRPCSSTQAASRPLLVSMRNGSPGKIESSVGIHMDAVESVTAVTFTTPSVSGCSARTTASVTSLSPNAFPSTSGSPSSALAASKIAPDRLSISSVNEVVSLISDQ